MFQFSINSRLAAFFMGESWKKKQNAHSAALKKQKKTWDTIDEKWLLIPIKAWPILILGFIFAEIAGTCTT